MTTREDPVSIPRSEGSQMPEPERRMERLLGLLIAGLIFLNYPLLSIFSVSAFFCGIPVLYFYLFFTWSLIIGITAFILGGKPPGSVTASESRDSRES